MHRLDSPYADDQLARRVLPLNAHPITADGAYVLYWMQAYQRLDDNWAFRYAVREADRLGRPLVVHQGLDPSYPYASDRIHAFVLGGAGETARRAEELNVHYQFVLRRRRDDDRRVVDRLAARAALVVTDCYPTAGVRSRSARFADRVRVHVAEVDGHGIVPATLFPGEEYAARTIRPKLARVREHYLEPVETRGAQRRPNAAELRAIADVLQVPPLDLSHANIGAEIAACEIDHGVPPAPLVPGRAAALARLDRFLDIGFGAYDERRREPADDDGSSRLSPYLHFGHIGSAEVARAVLERGPEEQAEAYLDEVLTWRELAFNFCLRNPHHQTLDALPGWARATLDAHASDSREHLYTVEQLERGETHDPLWNAAQLELVSSGQLHNTMRQIWGKSVLLWTRDADEALSTLITLNDRWALDGRDPNSYTNILWCLGKFDRPFRERPILGTVRPISLQRAWKKFDLEPYVARWGRPEERPLSLGL